MLRQLIHGLLVLGEIVGNGLSGESRWGWLLLLTAGAMAINAVGFARKISEELICIQPAMDQR
jgi:hypothetical protein